MRLSVSTPRMEIGRLIVRAAVVVPRDTPISDAAQVMRAENVSSILVGGAGAILTERDLTNAWVDGCSASDPVSEIATIDPVTVDAGTAITDAAALMLNRDVRHLVVTERGACLGIVSLRTVLAVLLQAADPDIWLTELRVTLSGTPDSWLG